MIEPIRGGLEAEPIDVKRRRADWPAYTGNEAVGMVHGQSLHLLPGDAYSERLYVFRRQHIGLLLALARISLATPLGGPSIAIDVGANVGYLAAWLAQRSDIGTVVAIEPNPRLVPVLERNLGSRGQVIHAVATRHSGRREFPVNAIDSSWSGFENPSSMEFRLEQVPAVAVDDILNDGTQIGLLKVDVEGHEREVLAGASKTISTSSPVLVVEINQEQENLIRDVRDLTLRSRHRYQAFVADCEGFLQAVTLKAPPPVANDLILVPDWAHVRIE